MQNLTEETIPSNTIINVKSRCPVITIQNVPEFLDEANFVEKVTQNQQIAEKINEGSEFSIVFTKKPDPRPGFKQIVDNENNTCHQIVARVSEEICEIIKSSKYSLDLLPFAYSIGSM